MVVQKWRQEGAGYSLLVIGYLNAALIKFEANKRQPGTRKKAPPKPSEALLHLQQSKDQILITNNN
jgi:hypothetical protein